jgi:hypothetical protein
MDNIDNLIKRRNHGSQTCILDTQVHPDEEQQTLLAAWVYVSTATASGGKPGQDRLENFYQRVYLDPILCHIEIPPSNVELLFQQNRLDEAVYQ